MCVKGESLSGRVVGALQHESKGGVRQCEQLRRARSCELKEELVRANCLAGARPCKRELLSGARPCELKEELVPVS